VGSLTVSEDNTSFASAGGMLLNKSETTVISYAAAQSSFSIPGTVTEIAYEAFSGCDSLTEMTIPYSVTSMGTGAFMNCGNLRSIRLSDNCPTVPAYAFSGIGISDMTFNGSIS
jgi:hypothetical protein